MGKRQIGQLQPNELAITILISNMATLPIENTNMPLAFGVIPIFILICFELFISFLCMKSKLFRNIISGCPVLIINNGKINQKAMKSMRFSTDDLIGSLRSCEVFDISKVAYAFVETNGTMSVVKKFEEQNTTPKMFNLKHQETTIKLMIISDGQILKKNLNQLGLSTKWLSETLNNKHLNPKQIFLMTADKNGDVLVLLKENEK